MPNTDKVSDSTKRVEQTVEREVNEIADDLQVSLPKTNLPILVKLVALFTLVGGLSIAGSTFADIFNPDPINFWLHIFRFITGLVFIFISYGIVKRERWSIWLYGALIVLAGIFITGSPPVLVIPAAIVLYLYSERNYFRESIFDVIAHSIHNAIKRKIH